MLEIKTDKKSDRPAYELGKLAFHFVAKHKALRVPDADHKLICFTDHYGEKHIDWLATIDRIINKYGHIWNEYHFQKIAEINNWFLDNGTNKLTEDQYIKDYTLGWISAGNQL